jgi:hypothetical protein
MANEKSGINGKVEWELRDEHGNLKGSGVSYNLITTVGDTLYGSRAIAGVNSNGVSAATQPTGMKLGTGSTTSTNAPAKSGTGAALTGYLSTSNKAFDATFPTGALVGGDAGYVVTYKRTYAAGEATSAGAAITEAVIVTDSIATDATSTAANTIARVALTGIASKQSTDTLTVTWTHTLLGA